MNINVWRLFLCQAMTNAMSIAQVSMSALIGWTLAPDKTLATLPFALQMAGTMAASIPAGIIFARFGRKTGFLLGCLAAVIGIFICMLGLYDGSFWLFCVGAVPTGLGFGVGQHYRFAASEVASPAQRPRAIALVMAGGVLSAIIGPELVKHSKDIAGPILFLGTYAIMMLLPITAAILLAFTDLPPAPPPNASPTPMREILARPAFMTAVIAGLVGYGAMNLIMAATPLQMKLCGFGVDDSTDVIRVHALSMFAPGFVTGRLIQRFGVHRIIVTGGILTVICAVLAVAEPLRINFMIALALLGLGWNFMFVGATTLLASAHTSAEKVHAQAANDFIVFSTVTITAFSSGALHNYLGWTAVNFAVIPPVLIALGLVLWHRSRAHGPKAAAI